VVDLEGAVFWMVADALVNVTLASAYKANPKVLAKWLPMGKSTIYNRRKKGNGESAMFLERLDEIHIEQQFRGALEDLRWSTLFEHLGVSAIQMRLPRTPKSPWNKFPIGGGANSPNRLTAPD
jgi:hypothetical protein